MFASETIPSPELPVIEVTKYIKFEFKAATIVIWFFAYTLLVYWFTMHYQYLGLRIKYPYMVYIFLISRLFQFCFNLFNSHFL